MRLHDFLESGNGYKVRLLLALLRRDYERVEVDIVHGASRTPAFLALNPNGRIPTLELDDGRVLAESNAILFYLAQDTAFWPSDPFERALVMQWMCFEQYSHEPNIAVLRHWTAHDHLDDNPEDVAQRRQRGEEALDVMEAHLAGRAFFVGEHYSIADIALYAYTHVADEGGFDLSRRSVLRGWLDRVRSQPNHVGLRDPGPH